MSRHALGMAGLALLWACSSAPATPARPGEFASASDYRSLDRAEFTYALTAGLADVDQRHVDLEMRARSQSQDAVDALHDQDARLSKLRTEFTNELGRLRAALDEHWKDHRDEAVEALAKLREGVDQARADVLGTS